MNKRSKIVILLLIICAFIAVVPLAILKDTEFGGADGAAEELITQISPDYEPWIDNILEPPGGETESLLFCLQAAIGASILGFGFGYFIARKKYINQKD